MRKGEKKMGMEHSGQRWMMVAAYKRKKKKWDDNEDSQGDETRVFAEVSQAAGMWGCAQPW